jgi:glycosyltransferase involved in cell wall biosynthesis
MKHIAFAVPGDLATPTGGYVYDRRIIQELRRLRWQVDVVDIGGGFPFPSIAQRATALAILSAIPAGCPVVLDGLAFGALPEAGALRCHRSLIALVHQPLALDPGLENAQADTFRASERAALAATARVVVTSEATARILIGDYDVPAQRISVVRPGNDPVPPALGSNDGVVRLLSIGSVLPVKGYDLLIAAVAMLKEMPWQLTIAGDRTRNPGVAAQLDAEIEAYGLGNRVAVLGAVAPGRVIELYLASDVFVLASRFEGYGMALAEAIAHGLPVVSTLAGAIPDTVPPGTGLLVPPDDVTALAQALRRVIGNPADRPKAGRRNSSAGSTSRKTSPVNQNHTFVFHFDMATQILDNLRSDINALGEAGPNHWWRRLSGIASMRTSASSRNNSRVCRQFLYWCASKYRAPSRTQKFRGSQA